MVVWTVEQTERGGGHAAEEHIAKQDVSSGGVDQHPILLFALSIHAE